MQTFGVYYSNTSAAVSTWFTIVPEGLSGRQQSDDCREVERVHAAVVGRHVRSVCLLPLEMYLEEGIPLVCYLRHQPFSQLVETSEHGCTQYCELITVDMTSRFGMRMESEHGQATCGFDEYTRQRLSSVTIVCEVQACPEDCM